MDAYGGEDDHLIMQLWLGLVADPLRSTSETFSLINGPQMGIDYELTFDDDDDRTVYMKRNCMYLSRGARPLLVAALGDRLDVIQRIIAEGVDINARCGGADGFNDGNADRTAIHFAAHNGNVEMVRSLIESGCDPTAEDSEGDTALHYAAAAGEVEVARVLLSEGADVSAASYSGRTPIHFAAEKGKTEMVELLIEHGGDPHVADRDGRRAVHFATFVNWISLLQVLIQHGCDLSAKCGSGATPLHCAAIRSNGIVALKILLNNGVEIDAVDAKGCTALLVGVEKQREDVVRILTDAGCDPNIPSNHIYYPLHVSCKASSSSLAITKYLLAAGANPDVQNISGAVPLFTAIKTNNLEVIRLLIEHGCGVGEVSEEGLTPLHIAAKYQNDEFMKLLLDSGADIDAMEPLKCVGTPLHYAAAYAGPDTISFLVDEGANRRITDSFRQNPLNIASRNQRLTYDSKGLRVLLLLNDGLK